jgi:hypothetical protein
VKRQASSKENNNGSSLVQNHSGLGNEHMKFNKGANSGTSSGLALSTSQGKASNRNPSFSTQRVVNHPALITGQAGGASSLSSTLAA